VSLSSARLAGRGTRSGAGHARARPRGSADICGWRWPVACGEPLDGNRRCNSRSRGRTDGTARTPRHIACTSGVEAPPASAGGRTLDKRQDLRHRLYRDERVLRPAWRSGCRRVARLIRQRSRASTRWLREASFSPARAARHPALRMIAPPRFAMIASSRAAG
jgi:hypothetical protein